MHMKCLYSLLFIFFVVAIIPTYTNDHRSGCDVDFDFCENPEIAAIINQTAWNIERECDKANAAATLIESGVIPLLQEPFFARSNNINSRSLLDYPEFLPFRHDQDKKGFMAYAFYNQTSRCHFTKDSTNICSYLAITEPGFMEALKNILDTISTLKPELDPNKLLNILGLFTPFTVQERRLGLMFCGKQKFRHWHGQIFVPLYYLERNHFVDDATRIELENAVAELTGVPVSQVDQQEQTKFQDAHFISDKLGIGDTRFMIDHPVIKRVNWTMRVGGLMTIPTAIALTKGLKGTSFCRITNPQPLDICGLISTAVSNPETSLATTQAMQWGLSALDNVNAILLDSPLGNNGHLELGVYTKNKFPVSRYLDTRWCRDFVWRNFTALQYQLPAWETRSFIIPVDYKAFAQQNFDPSGSDTEVQVIGQQNYNFIIDQLNARLFPIALRAKVHPSFILRMCSNLCYEKPSGGFTLGTDTWIRAGEYITKIQAPCGILSQVDKTRCFAQAPFAFQSKIYGSAFFKRKKENRVWAVGIAGDYTYWTIGIGKDFSLMLLADVTF